MKGNFGLLLCSAIKEKITSQDKAEKKIHVFRPKHRNAELLFTKENED